MEQRTLPDMFTRLGAYIVDSFLYSILFFGFLCALRQICLSYTDLTALLSSEEFEKLLISNISIWNFLLVFFFCTFVNLGGLFSWLVVWLMKGSSPGKKIFKIKIVKEYQQALTFKDIFVREFLMKGLCTIITSGIFSFISLFLGFYRKDHKTLHDISAETLVISTKGK